ncbi:MAG: hypothetical protein PHN59_05635 [Candidatus Omnitrophica bacterium]|nr:hypothetical protein [Candidatus Omnitrophota bacterium]
MKKLLNRKSQSILEYTLLIIVITSALLAMYPYMRRAVNAKLKHVQIELNEWKR